MVLKGKIFAAPFLKALKEEFFSKEKKKKTTKNNSLSIKIAVTMDKCPSLPSSQQSKGLATGVIVGSHK